MDLRKSFEEQEKRLLFGEEPGDAYRSNFRNSRWVCEWPSWLDYTAASTRQGPTSTTRNNTVYLAPPKSDKGTNPSPSFAQSTSNFTNNAPTTTPNVNSDQQQQSSSRVQTREKSTHLNQNQNPPILITFDNPNPNQLNSSDDDDDGEEQDDESDSTESVSTDSDDSTRKTPTRIIRNTHKSLQTEIYQEKIIHEINTNENNDEDQEQLRLKDWPENRPLPYPLWASTEPELVEFDDVLQYEEFAGRIEFISQRTVSGHKYNTVENFIRFYRAFKKSKMDSLENFYRQYQPPITSCHYTCVGLAYELIAQINCVLPRNHSAVDKFYIVSCEEAIETTDVYTKHSPPEKETVEKEHVSVCLRFRIGSNRNGILLLDPGYHVSRVVTIMDDQTYPHTGKFAQTDDDLSKKEYEYTLHTSDYVSWEVNDTKKGKTKSHTSLIFVGKPFLSGVDFAERRNLVYDFKSCLKRDPKGHVTAGLFFPLKKENPKTMTIFFTENNKRTNIRISVSRNVRETREIQTCEEQMGLQRGKLTQIMNSIGRLMHDDNFVEQTLNLNEEIVRISAEN